jgi:hypothetical protein
MRTSVVSYVKPLYQPFSKFSNKLQSPFLLAIRLYWGWQFSQSLGKLHSSHSASYLDQARSAAVSR